ncbi:MAG: CHAT domain-containing protein [Candidatus Methanofastidiosia archaeon]
MTFKAEWGESLFAQVFTKCDFDPDPRLLYHEAIRHGLNACELCIISDDTRFLGIPWELIRDPTPGRGYLALLLGGFYRKLPTPVIGEDPESRRPFRILLVISRPLGERDIPIQTVAHPVMQALRPFPDRIELEVLRPPTFDTLQKCLNANRGYYHCVHFDGHGILGKSQAMRGGKSGYLLFENEKGEEYPVSSEELGQALATCKVPLFVLNACQSAQEGEDPYSSVASQLVALGAKGVVAMSYSVYSTAASKFMQRFYEKLVENCTLGEAVAAGRMKLYADPFRESVIGPLKLADWMVPCLYQKKNTVPIPWSFEPGESSSEIRESVKTVCEVGQFGFVGRDNDILKIERALTNDERPWVVVSGIGIGGVGKTALVHGFANWYAETGVCPGGLFITSNRRNQLEKSSRCNWCRYGRFF